MTDVKTLRGVAIEMLKDIPEAYDKTMAESAYQAGQRSMLEWLIGEIDK